MSYSYGATGASKTEVILDAEAKFDSLVLATQPIHSVDKALALARVRDSVNLLPDPAEDEVVAVSVSGYISVQTNTAGPDRVLNVNSSCTASIQRKQV